jgi:hypothetical protein
MLRIGNYEISYDNDSYCDVGDMLGATLVDAIVSRGPDGGCVVFVAEDGRGWVMSHDRDCCEEVEISDVVGDFADLLNSPLLRSEESESRDDPPGDYSDSFTWTFYRFATVKGDVDTRWLGMSNGYYSEAVQFRRLAFIRRLFPDPMGRECAAVWHTVGASEWPSKFVPNVAGLDSDVVSVALDRLLDLNAVYVRNGRWVQGPLKPPLGDLPLVDSVRVS